MSNEQTFGLSQENLDIVRSLLRAATAQKTLRVWVFGSRARGDHRKYSDLDLLIEAHPPLSMADLTILKDRFENSDLPIIVEIVPAESLYAAWKDQVEEEKIELSLGAFSPKP